MELEAAKRVSVVTDGAVLLHFVEELRRRRRGDGKINWDVVGGSEIALKC